MRRILFWVLWAWYLLVTLLLSLGLAWVLLAQFDFCYPLLYEPAGIDGVIARHGPENRLRPGFETTSRQERERLFGAIVQSIHRRGEGLEALHYHAPDGSTLGPLLTRPEIRHLRDVADLIQRARPWWWGMALLWLVQTGFWWRRRSPLPSPGGWALLGAALIGIPVLAVLIAGPVAVFYGLHRLLFPADHQWFFYYQESLMSMMMRAPDLFGYIAVLLLIIGLLSTLGILAVLNRNATG